MSTTIIGFPRLGEFRELKFTTEKYFRKEISEEELLAAAKELRAKHWNIVKEKGITEIPSNDFSHYDNFLDAAFLFNVVPASVQNLDLSDLERYFALGRGYQGEKGDVRALPMKKWFNTNYHYIVPKFEKDTQVKLAGHKIFDEFQEAKELGLNTRPVLVGPFTFLQLSDFEEGVKAEDFVDSLVVAYQEVFAKLAELGATRIQLDEAALVKDLTDEEKALFLNLYNKLLADKKGLEVLLQTYFGDVRDVYADLVNLPVDAIGLDFVEGKKTLELVKGGFPADKTLYAGIVNGKNIWRNNYEKSLAVLEQIPAENIVLTSSCSLLHVPFTTANEEFEPAILNHFAFAVEKLDEIRDLAMIDLLASTGMRVGELVGLNREDINFYERECVVFGKGNSERIVYFDARTKIHLINYLDSRTDDNPALFVSLSSPHDRLLIGGVETRLRQLGEKADLNKVHPHKFRRTLATRAIDKGMPIEQVQHLLGHVKIDTTMHYAMVNQANVKNSRRKYIGLGEANEVR